MGQIGGKGCQRVGGEGGEGRHHKPKTIRVLVSNGPLDCIYIRYMSSTLLLFIPLPPPLPSFFLENTHFSLISFVVLYLSFMALSEYCFSRSLGLLCLVLVRPLSCTECHSTHTVCVCVGVCVRTVH